jgi:hypothetical protein
MFRYIASEKSYKIFYFRMEGLKDNMGSTKLFFYRIHCRIKRDSTYIHTYVSQNLGITSKRIESETPSLILKKNCKV